MNFEDITYQEFVTALLNLKTKAEKNTPIENIIEETSNEFVIKGITDEELLDIIKRHNLKIPAFTPEILKELNILKQTIKITALMEASNNWKNFTLLDKKRKRRVGKKAPLNKNKQLTDFDKLLKAIAKVPKPNK